LLAERVGAAPWDGPDWFAAWRASFGRGKPCLLVLRRGAGLAGVLALEDVHGALRAPTNWHTPSFGGVFADGAAAATLLDAALARTRRHLELSFLDSGSFLPRAAEELRLGPGRRTHSRVIERSPYLPLPDSAEALEATLSAKRRSSLRRIRRRLAELGEVSLCVSDGGARLDALLADGFEVEGSGWKGESGTAIYSHPTTLQFYTEIAHRFARRGWLRLAFLRLDGRPIAFDLAVERAGVHYLLKTGYVESLRSHAPGIALRHEMILRCIANGCKTYEFLGSDVPWKREWARSSHDRLQLYAFRETVPGRAHFLFVARALPVARRVRDHLVR
jgi:CelD/BcsL family acetyltransferase involved in cellulose biosynthesis